MKSTVQAVLVCLFLSFMIGVKAQTPPNYLIFVSANDTSVTFVPKYRSQYPQGFYFDTARMEFVVQVYPFGDTATIAQIGYTDTSFTSPVTVGGLSPSTTYNLLAYGLDANWDNTLGQFGQSDFVFTTTGPVGMQDIQTDIFSVYPNPASDHITIQGEVQDKELVVIDLNGKMVFQTLVNQFPINLDVSTLSNGAYILSIGNTKKRIIVNH